MLWRKIILLTLLLTATASGAYAQNRFEIEPFVGARFGGRITINTPDVDYLPIDTSLNWGFTTGVAIVRHIAEAHGGSAGVRSMEGIGSTFWIELPRADLI